MATDGLKAKIIDLFKNLTNMHDMDRDVLKDFIQTEIDGHKSFIKALSGMSKNDMNKFREKLFTILPSSKIKAVSGWQEYTKSLQTKPAQVEHAMMFDSVLKTRVALQAMLEDISKKLNTIFDNEIISITDLRQTQVAALGMITLSMIFSNWSLYVWTLLTALVDGTEDEIPRYRLDYITKHTKDAITATNSFLGNEKLSITDSLMKIRAKGEDRKLAPNGIVDTNLAVGGLIGVTVLYVSGIVAFATMVTLGIVFIRYLFTMTKEYMEVAAHKRYLKNKEMKEWLEAHVAKLKMDLQSINRNDPQYQKLSKIIDVYDEKICDLDEKINEYMNE